jgi:hypothetical protein
VPKAVKVAWLDEPEEKNYLAAASFLSMVLSPGSLAVAVSALRDAPMGDWTREAHPASRPATATAR